MVNTPYHSTSLRYVDADRLDKHVLDLDGLDVKNTAGDRLGDVDGFLVDAASGRPRYIVVDSGGWFSSKRFLVPVHHARVDADRRALRVDFDRETINRFPRLEEDRFEAVTDEEARMYDQGVLRAWESSATYPPGPAAGAYEPGTTVVWWNASAWMNEDVDRSRRADRVLAEDETRIVREEPVIARAEDTAVDERTREEHRAPAYGERAQPGDVLGIESGGETTSVGDTARDEDKRREESERYFEKNRDRK